MVALNHRLIDASIDQQPSLLAGLNTEQQSRLTEQLDRYLVSLENGEPIDPKRLALENPDIASVFDVYLEKINALCGVVVGFSDPELGPSLPEIESGTKKLGDFTILRQIGRGGMGLVYEATQESLSRRVAIKLLPLASLLDARQITRFKNEAHAAGSLNHPNIVPVYSVGREQGVHYYAMQYIHGLSMDAWLQKHGASSRHASQTPFPAETSCATPWQTILGWIIDVADALRAAHETGIVHRDVKPSNLMLDENGKIWITDFGLARCQTETTLTQSGDVIGTMRYMSPEQARGQTALVDGRTDIYSLAATAYEMLTLCPAHPGDDAPTILKRIDEQQITPLRNFRPDVPRDLETVLAKAMSHQRDGRYETAAQFAEDLRRVVQGEPTIARPPTVVDRISRFAARYRVGVLTTICVGFLGLIGLAVSTALIAAEKRISDDNAIRAARNEQLARGAVDRLGSQMAELLVGIPAADSVRRTLLNETLNYYQTFAASADRDPALKEDLAITYGKIGELQQELGESEQALRSLVRSEALYADLALTDKRVRLDWSTSQNNLAGALAKTGQLEQAARFFARAIKSQRAIVAQSSALGAGDGLNRKATARAKRQLAATLNNLGLLLAEAQAPDEAEETYLEAIEILRTDNDLRAETEANQQLATILANLSGLLAKDSPDRAIAYARAALVLQTDALESDSRNAKLATQVIVTLNTLGSAQVSAGHQAQAIETFRRSIDIAEQLLLRWPDQPIYRRDLVVGWNHLGLAYSKAGDLSQASQAFQSALDIGRPLAVTFAMHAEIQSMLAGVLNNLGFLQQQLGQHETAARTYVEAIELQSLAVKLAPQVKRYRQYLRKHNENHRAMTTAEDQPQSARLRPKSGARLSQRSKPQAQTTPTIVERSAS